MLSFNSIQFLCIVKGFVTELTRPEVKEFEHVVVIYLKTNSYIINLHTYNYHYFHYLAVFRFMCALFVNAPTHVHCKLIISLVKKKRSRVHF